jgi:hypothetical protein
LLALLALGSLALRPLAADVLDVGPAPQEMKIVGLADGGHYCIVNSACDALTTTGIGLDTLHGGFLLLLLGVVFLVGTGPRRGAIEAAPLPRHPPPRHG